MRDLDHRKGKQSSGPYMCCYGNIVLDITVDLLLSLFSVLLLSKCFFKVIIVIIYMYIVSPFFAVMLYNV